jgi:tetratricopeptide (TPR) repeat protein
MGRLAFMRGRIDEALHWTTQAAQLDPKRRRIRVLLCQIYQQLNDLKAVNEQVAVIDSLPAVSPYYEWPDPLLEEVGRIKHDAAETKLRAQQLIDTGHPQEAIALLSQLGDRKSRDVQLLILLGKAHGRMGDFARAKELLIVARDRDPGQAPVHFELGNLARATGSYEDAVGHYQEAVRLEPGYAIAYYHMSTCCRELGDNDGAIAALQQACRSVPNNLRVRRELVELLWRNGQREHALEQVKEILRLAPNDSETKLLLDRLQLNSSLVEPAEDALHLEDRPEPS